MEEQRAERLADRPPDSYVCSLDTEEKVILSLNWHRIGVLDSGMFDSGADDFVVVDGGPPCLRRRSKKSFKSLTPRGLALYRQQALLGQFHCTLLW